MDFGLSQEISEDVVKQSAIITDISDKLTEIFKAKEYGEDVLIFTIGVISIKNDSNTYFDIRKKYNKKKKLLEYDIKFDHQILARGDGNEILRNLINQIIESLNIITELNIKNFDFVLFEKDLKKFLQKEG